MKRRDTTISECNFGEDAVPYLYGELPDADRAIFESHLLECTACTDEFAAMASTRYEVYDWKKIEFDPLATPRFEIPSESESWTDRIRSTFGRGWAIPGFAFAGLAVISIFASTFWLTSGERNEIASSSGAVDNSSAGNGASVPVRIPSVEEPIAPAGEVRDVRSPEQIGRTRVDPVVRSERRSNLRNVSTAQPKRIAARPESTRAVKVDVPRLNGFPDDEDTSLRLAELFEDGETRD